MPNTTFYRQFMILVAATGVLLFFLNQLSLFQSFTIFSWICLAFFTLFTLFMFFIGKQTAQNRNKNLFTGAVLALTFGKIMLSFVVVFFYFKFGQPDSKAFLIPFFITYLVFTVYETYLMMKLGKQKVEKRAT